MPSLSVLPESPHAHQPGSRFFCVHGGFRTQAQLSKSLAVCDCPPRGQGSETENSNPLNFPGGPVVKNPHFQCRVHGFSPRPGKFCGAAKKEKKKKKFQSSNHMVGSVGNQPPPILKDSSKVTVDLGLKRTDIYSLEVWRPEV